MKIALTIIGLALAAPVLADEQELIAPSYTDHNRRRIAQGLEGVYSLLPEERRRARKVVMRGETKVEGKGKIKSETSHSDGKDTTTITNEAEGEGELGVTNNLTSDKDKVDMNGVGSAKGEEVKVKDSTSHVDENGKESKTSKEADNVNGEAESDNGVTLFNPTPEPTAEPTADPTADGTDAPTTSDEPNFLEFWIESMIEGLWKRVNTDGNDELTKDELFDGMTKLGHAITMDEVDTIFGDQETISYEDFQVYARELGSESLAKAAALENRRRVIFWPGLLNQANPIDPFGVLNPLGETSLIMSLIRGDMNNGRRRAVETTEATPEVGSGPTAPPAEVDPKLLENIKIFEQFIVEEAANGLWTRLDTNSDDVVTPEELHEVMSKAGLGLTKEDVVALFAQDKSGQVTREDFMASMFGINKNEPVQAAPVPDRRRAVADQALEQDVVENMVDNLWNHLDKDTSGDLTQDELTKGLTELGVPITKEEVAKAFGDKKILTREEFEAVAHEEAAKDTQTAKDVASSPVARRLSKAMN